MKRQEGECLSALEPFNKPACQLWSISWIADNEFLLDLPNRTINLLIQWIRQNNDRMPERRRNAPELLLLEPLQIERVEAIVAGCFPGDGTVGN